MKKSLILLLFTALCAPCSALADGPTSADLTKQLQALQAQLQALIKLVNEQQSQIDMLKSSQEQAQQGAAPSSAGLPRQPIAPPAKGGFPAIPDIGVVGDIVGTSSDTLPDEEGNDRLSVRELELVMGSDIDPYSRFDTTLAFSDSEHVHLEEAYASYWGLPYGIKGRIGRMHQYIGKASTVHRDSLPTVDEPLVIQEYLGTEGFYRTGVDFSGFLPLSGDRFTQHLAVGMMEGGTGEGGTLFGGAENRPSFYSRLSNFWDISDLTNFELGGTYLLGSGDDDSDLEVHAFGIDGTFVHFFSPINKLTLQSEFFFQRRSGSPAAHGAVELHDHTAFVSKHEHEEEPHQEDIDDLLLDARSFGFYTLADYRLAQRWAIGSRYDFVEPIALAPANTRDHDQALSCYLTFFQSEFARWRLQYEHARLVSGKDDDRFFLQGTFAIGTHKHQIQ